MRVLVLIGLGLWLSGCEIDTITRSYKKNWDINLANEITSLSSPVNFGGLNLISDDHIVILLESQGNNLGSSIEALTLNSQGAVQDIRRFDSPGFNIDILNYPISMIPRYLAEPSQIGNPNSLLLVTESEFTIRPLSNEIFLNPDVTQIHLGATNVFTPYQPGTTAIDIVSFDLEGNEIWRTPTTSQSVTQLLAGSFGGLFVLGETTQQIVEFYDHNGNRIWTTELQNLISDLDRAIALYRSDFNTLVLIAQSAEQNLLLAAIDQRGDLIFRRNIQQYNAQDVSDFIFTNDGTFLMATIGENSSNSPYTISKMNQSGSIIWNVTYTAREIISNVHLLENNQGEVFVLTNTGEITQIEPGVPDDL